MPYRRNRRYRRPKPAVPFAAEALESRALLAATLVGDIGVEDVGTSIPSGAAVGDNLYVAASTPEYGLELWRSDGTPDGTSLVKDVAPGPDTSRANKVFAVGDDVYFVTEGPDRSQDALWRTNGSDASTVCVAHVVPRAMAALGDWLYFLAGDDASDLDLWRSDGTPGGTAVVARTGTYPGWKAYTLVAAGGRLYFVSGNPQAGEELWTSDGTAGGTHLVRDIRPGPEGASITGLSAAGGKAFFLATPAADGKQSFWPSDGTEAGTQPLNAPGPSQYTPEIVTVGGQAVYLADGLFGGPVGGQVWASDGTPQGTRLLKDLVPGASWPMLHDLTAMGGRAYFTALLGGNDQLWATDGTAGGTTRVELPVVTDIEGIVAATSDTLFFYAEDAKFDVGFWKYTRATGASLIGDANPKGWGATLPTKAWGADGLLYFLADDGSGVGAELHRTDGTPEGTFLLRNLETSNAGSRPDEVSVHNGDVYFMAARDSNAYSLFVSRKGESEPVPLATFDYDGRRGALQRGSAWVGDTMYFPVFGTGPSEQLWKTDGTPQGTTFVKEVGPAASSLGRVSRVWDSFVSVGGRLFFE